MFFNDIGEIATIAARTGTSVFVVPREMTVKIPGAILLQPEEKPVITVEQVRAACAKVCTRQTQEMFVLIRPADKLPPISANTLLKTLEQPVEKVHFALITDTPSVLLPTILSRAAIYMLRPQSDPLRTVTGSEEAKALARQLLAARGADLVALAQEITKKKDGVQQRALEVLGLAIEMAYKTYLQNMRPAFLAKLPRLLTAYENIARGGNIKLQIVGNLA